MISSITCKMCIYLSIYLSIYVATDMWTPSHWAGVTLISRLSPAWKFKLHFTRITDVSSAFCNCQVNKYPPPSKKKKKNPRKNKNKALFNEKKVPGKTPLYQRSLEHLTTLSMTSVYFHFFSLSLCHFFLSIVYNRGARLARACFDTPSW